MIEKVYNCDFCKEKKQPQKLHALVWFGDHPGGHWIETVAVDNAETHICTSCVDAIKQLTGKDTKCQ